MPKRLPNALPPDAATTLFEAERPRQLRLVYRMLDSFAEDEDVVLIAEARPDVFPAGDLGVRVGLPRLMRLAERPGERRRGRWLGPAARIAAPPC